LHVGYGGNGLSPPGGRPRHGSERGPIPVLISSSGTGACYVNQEKIYSEVLQGAPFLKKVVEAFVHSMSDRLNELEKALKDGRFQELSVLAHRLKGAGGTHGYPAVTAAARSLQEAALRSDSAEAERWLKELRSLADRLVPEAPPETRA